MAALTELRAGIREDRAAAALATGEDLTLLDELAALTTEFPLRERAWALRARALYRTGRRADALAVLRTARDLLAEELTAQGAGQLPAALADSSGLLVLDNCEHVLDAVAELLTTLLPACPGVRVVTTSREPVDLPGNSCGNSRRCPPPRPSSCSWTARRPRHPAPHRPATTGRSSPRSAPGSTGSRWPSSWPPPAAAPCSVGEIADALDDRFSLLVVAGRGNPARHRSLERTIALSVDDLDPADRRLFAALSVFTGGFDAAAAAAVVGAPVRDGLATLVAKSLVGVAAGAPGPRRFALLETLRAFGDTLLDDAGRAAARTAHRRWVLDVVTVADAAWLGHDAARWFGRVRAEQPNVRAALADGRTAAVDDALRLAGALAAAGPDADPEAVGLAHVASGPLRYLAGDPAGAAADVAAGLERVAPARHPTKVARGLAFRAYLAAATDPAAAQALLGEALAVSRAAGDGPGESETLMAAGHLARLGGDTATALDVLRSAVAVARRAGHGFADGSSRWHLVKTLLDRGDAAAALDEAESLVRFLGGEPDVTSWLVATHTLAGALGQSGDGVRGARLLGAVSAIGGEVGYRPEEMDPQDSERDVALVRAALGGSAERYATAFTEGVAGGRATVAAVLDELGDGDGAARAVGRSA
ncbi:BTAD domain-containing putative transcriptional regulator [Pseudonocardia sp. HH130629-09]|uniref:BTAD domain-containing putative transcriptional regulator n=1 Tax=Pseudonocardia sp. HH130629-09 TaxID=1641402 RepID=UPI0006CB3324|nr:BTAD domain-containing putative transcriptional regulator [Pseudonocardia sp. HH130629-09]ALE84637.1 hypothetical protein XF36_17065 [Pseudonocardia sp. HH130629-09]